MHLALQSPSPRLCWSHRSTHIPVSYCPALITAVVDRTDLLESAVVADQSLRSSSERPQPRANLRRIPRAQVGCTCTRTYTQCAQQPTKATLSLTAGKSEKTPPRWQTHRSIVHNSHPEGSSAAKSECSAMQTWHCVRGTGYQKPSGLPGASFSGGLHSSCLRLLRRRCAVRDIRDEHVNLATCEKLKPNV